MCLLLFLLQGKCAFAEKDLAWRFLASTPGFTTVLTDTNGLTMQLEVLEARGDRLLIEQRTCCFDINQDGAMQVARYRLNFSVDGSRLILVEGDVESVLLDLESKNWTIPVEIQTFEAGGSSSSSLAKCTIASRKRVQLLGEEREVLSVQCSYKSEGIPESIVMNSFASGLGIVQLNDFKLVGLEK